MDTPLTIREMRDDEKPMVKRVMRRSFNPIGWLFFSFGEKNFVAEADDRIIGAVCLSLFRMPGGRTGGLVKWIFTDPDSRGLGAAQQLVDRAVGWFGEHEAVQFACVEGYNTSSSKLFVTRGFRRIPPGEQFRRWGLGTFRIWWNTFHLFDIGHFLWMRPATDSNAAAGGAPESRERPAAAWIANVVVNTLIGYAVLLRWGGFPALNGHALWHVPAILLGLFAIRSTAMVMTARARPLPVEYRIWETGLGVSFVVALVFGGVFPVPGSYYPRRELYRYGDEIDTLGPMSLAGGLSVLVVGWGVWTLSSLVTLGSAAAGFVSIALLFVRFLLVFEFLLPVFPFASFNGRRVLDWNGCLWLVSAVAAVALIVVGRL
jgi:GNAT superfamily N-acetyltransferase